MDAAGARGGRPESKMQEMQICNTLNLDMRPAKALRRRFKKTIKRQMDELAHLVPQEEGEDENEQGEDAVEQGTKSKTSKTKESVVHYQVPKTMSMMMTKTMMKEEQLKPVKRSPNSIRS